MSIIQLRCFITGVEYPITTDYSIKERVGQTTMADISVRIDEGEALPVSQQLVEITESDGTTPVYTGIIQAVDSPVWSSGYEAYIVDITCKSLDVLFDNRIVNEAFENKTTTEIVNSLFTAYLDEEGITLGTVATFTRSYEKYVSSGLTLRKVLSELGDSVNAAARIDAAGVFHFTSDDQFPEQTPPTHISRLKKQESGVKLRTVQRVTGANQETSLQTESKVWEANQVALLLGYQVSSVSGITINGAPAGVGIKGVDESDTTKTFLVRYGDNVVTVNSSASVKPVASDNVVAVYYGFYSVEIISENEALKSEISALNGTSGKIENIFVDTSITNYEDGQNLADDLLSSNETREETITGFYVSSDLSISCLLCAWNLSYPELGIEGRYVIVERTIKYFADEFKVSFKLKNKNFYSRDGMILDKNDQQLNNLSIRTDDLVFKTSFVVETAVFDDEFSIEHGGVIFYPVGAGSELYAPVTLDGFYPV